MDLRGGILLASGLGAGDNNLFNPEFTTGDLSKIKPVVRVVQVISVWIISIIGLSITISTILKQALHGLYATNPKFWDRVNEVHLSKIADANKDRQGGNEISMLLGFISSFGLSLLPNVKAMTEFDGDTTDPKTFFTKSLPISCLYLFIGVFIFYGYTTKVGEKVSMFGTELLDNFFLQVDPIEWAQKIPTSFAKINLSTSGSKADFDKAVNDVTKKAYSALITNLNDIQKERQGRVALDVESWVIDCMNNHREYTDAGKWSMSYNARTTTAESDLSKVHGSANNEETEITFAYQKPLAEFDTGTALPQASTDWLRFDVTFTKKSEKDNTTAVEAIMHGGKWITGASEATVDLGITTDQATLTGNSARGRINGEVVELKFAGGKLTVTFMDKKNEFPASLNEIEEITGLYYTYGGKSHAIKSIMLTGDQGGSITFSPKSGSSSVGNWNWGDGPENRISDDENSDGEDTEDGEDIGEPIDETEDPKDLIS